MFEHLNNIQGVSIYPLISLSIFFLFFVGLTAWALRADKNYLKRMGELPLDQNSPDQNNRGDENEC